MSPEDQDHLESVLRHIEKVQKNCLLLGTRLIKEGREVFGLRLISNGLIHDQSKLSNEVEWLYLRPSVVDSEPNKFKLAYRSHVTTNLHHPEAHDSIQDMSDLYLAEFVCDTVARSNEFGTDYRTWLKDTATKKYNFNTKQAVYQKLKAFTNTLLEEPFK